MSGEERRLFPAGRPKTHAEQILAELLNWPSGASDAQLAKTLGIVHQTVNTTCRGLAKRGLIAREPQGGTIINRTLLQKLPNREAFLSTAAPQDRPWSWEGNVQASVAAFLLKEGWTIVTMVDTASKEPGTDIVLERDGIPLWVTVKGLPVGTAKTQPYTQARHYFAGALLDVVLWRQEAPPDTEFAVALPVFSTYSRLAERSRWLQEAAPFDVLWVSEDGEVRREPGRSPMTC